MTFAANLQSPKNSLPRISLHVQVEDLKIPEIPASTSTSRTFLCGTFLFSSISRVAINTRTVGRPPRGANRDREV